MPCSNFFVADSYLEVNFILTEPVPHFCTDHLKFHAFSVHVIRRLSITYCSAITSIIKMITYFHVITEYVTCQWTKSLRNPGEHHVSVPTNHLGESTT